MCYTCIHHLHHFPKTEKLLVTSIHIMYSTPKLTWTSYRFQSTPGGLNNQLWEPFSKPKETKTKN